MPRRTHQTGQLLFGCRGQLRLEGKTCIRSPGKQGVRTYAVGLASPLPRIEIPLNDKTITLVPFAKSVSGSSISSAEGDFQPTNTIVDFFIEELYPHYGRFRINYEDVEQGADHDMDAIVLYEYQLVDAAGLPVDASSIGNAVALDITLTSEYAAGGIDQHMGYIISGTDRRRYLSGSQRCRRRACGLFSGYPQQSPPISR
jgi:Tfp pilus tip-associated adhesin PilY1